MIPHGFYSRPGLAYYLSGELHDKAFYPRTAEDYRKMNFKLCQRAGSKDFDALQHILELDNKVPNLL